MSSVARSFKFRVTGLNVRNPILGCLLFGLGMTFSHGGSTLSSINTSSVNEVLMMFIVATVSIVLAIFGWKYEDRKIFGRKNLPAKFFMFAGPISALYFGGLPFFRDNLRHEACAVGACIVVLMISLTFKAGKTAVKDKVHPEPVAV